VRTTIELSEDAYRIAKGAATKQKCSLGRAISQLIVDASGPISHNVDISEQTGFPTFRCIRRVTPTDVAALN